MSAPASIPKRLVITGISSLALFGAFMTVAYGELTAKGWDSLGAWIILLLVSCLFGVAQLVLMIVLAARSQSAKSSIIQVFSMHNLVWFLSLLVFTMVAGNVETPLSLIFIAGIFVSVISLLIIVVREKEERKEDPDLTDF